MRAANGFRLDDILRCSEGRLANAEALGDASAAIEVTGVATLGHAKASDIAFFFSKEYQRELPSARPGILVTGEPFVAPLEQAGLPFWKTSAIVACADPYLAMAKISRLVAGATSSVAHLPHEGVADAPKIHPTAIVDASAMVSGGAEIGPYCVVGKDAIIGPNTVLYPGCYVGPRAEIGRDTVLFPNVVLYEWTRVGNRVRIHAGSVLGADGFGYAPVLKDGKPVDHRKIYHLGRVVVEDDVELGACVLIDRATFGETRVGARAKIDNDVHLGHNTRVGEGAILCGKSATAGSATIGRFAYLGGMAGINNRAHVGDYAKIGGFSRVDRDVPAGETYVGMPARPRREHFRIEALLNKMLRGHRRKPSAESPEKEET